MHLDASNTNLPLAQIATSQHHQIEIDDSKTHSVRVSYIPPISGISGSIAVTLDSQLLFNVPMDLESFLDASGNGYVGFTASTNELASENHDIEAWAMCVGECSANPLD